MKPTRFFRPQRLALSLFSLLAAATLHAEATRYVGAPGSKLSIAGTSTLHDWTVSSQIISGFMEWESNSPIDPAQATLPALKVTPKVEVTLPVRSIKSDKSLMDNVMHEAMKKEQHPKVEYRLKEMKLKEAARKAGDPIQFDTKGDLTVAGVTKPVAMVVSIDKGADGGLKATGSANVKMSDFGIQPPAPKVALGMIKTGDDVKVTFEWQTKPGEKK
jgi:polyisoprenoid-binding protein YceI